MKAAPGSGDPVAVPVDADDDLEYRSPSPIAEVDATETSGLLGGSSNTQVKDGWDGLRDFDDEPWWRRPSVIWLVGPYALFTLAFGGSLVPKFNLIIDLVCKQYLADRSLLDPDFTFAPIVAGGDNPQCAQIPEVQQAVSTFTLVMNVVVGTLSAFTAPRLGAFSDRHGRKMVLGIVSAGGLVGEVIMILAATFPDTVSYKWLVFGSVFEGLCGSFTAGSIMSHTYTSDCTPPSRRAVAIGYLHACLFAGLACGPLLAGYLVKLTGQLLSIFYVTLGCHLVFIAWITFVLPESLSKRRQLIAREKHAKEQDAAADEDLLAGPSSGGFRGTIRSLAVTVRKSNPLKPLKVLLPTGSGMARVRRNLLILVAIDTVITSVAMSSGQVMLLYTEFVFGWRNFETSIFISFLSLIRVIILMVIFPIINYYFRVRPRALVQQASGTAPSEKTAGPDDLDVWLLRIALLSDVVGLFGYIFVRTSELFLLCAVMTAFGGLGSATIQASLTKTVPPDRVGQLLGATGFLHAIARIISPVILNGLYAATVKTYPQAVYVLLTAIFAFVLILSMFFRSHVFMSDDQPSAPASPPGRIRNSNQVEEEVEVMPQI